ncbi:PAS domain S-box protein [Methanospirillum lacunae]
MSIAIIAEDITSQKIGQKCQELMISVLQILNSRFSEGNSAIQNIRLSILQSSLVEIVEIELINNGSPLSDSRELPFFLGDINQGTSNTIAYKYLKSVLGERIAAELYACICRGETDIEDPFFTNGGSFYINSLNDLIISFKGPDLQDTILNQKSHDKYESLAIIPITSQRGVIGLLQLFDKRKNIFSNDILSFFEGISYFIGIALEHQQMEKDLKESEKKYRMIADNVQDVIWVMNLNGKFTYISPSVLQFLGYHQDEMLTKTIPEIVHPKYCPYILNMIQENIETVRRTKKPLIDRVEIRLSHKNGSNVWTEIVAQYMCDDLGNPSEIVGVNRNITDRKLFLDELDKYRNTLESTIWERTLALRKEITIRKQTEISLREMNQVLLDIINFSPDATFVVDSKGIVIAWNYAIEELSGFDASDIIGKHKDECSFIIYKKKNPFLIDYLFAESIVIKNNYHNIHRKGLVITAEKSSILIKGELKTIRIKAAPLYDTESNVIGSIESIWVL